MFSGCSVWRLAGRGALQSGYPAPFNTLFYLPPRLSRLDAVYERPDGRLVFFSGTEFWVSDGRQDSVAFYYNTKTIFCNVGKS